MGVVAIGMYHIRNGNGKFKNIYILKNNNNNNKPIMYLDYITFLQIIFNVQLNKR